MNTKLLYIFLGLCVVGCSHGDEGSGLGHDHHHGHATETSNSSEIELDSLALQMFGVESQAIEPGQFSDILVVSGQVIPAPQSSAVVSAPVSGLVTLANGLHIGSQLQRGTLVAQVNPSAVSGGDANAAAKAAYEAAKRELERVEPLRADGIVSERSYNEILAAYEQAKAAYSTNATGGRAVAPISGVVSQVLVREGEYVAAGAPIAAITGNINLTLRADVPEHYHAMLPTIATANVEFSNSPDVVMLDKLGAKRLNSQPEAATRPGYIPVYFSFVNNGNVVPGAMAKVYLIGKQRDNVLTVPIGAVSEQQGQYFVYENIDGDCFRKLPVRLGNTDGVTVEIIDGLQPGTEIVVKGMAAVRLAESSTVAPEGHSH